MTTNDDLLKPHNVWECECEDCRRWRLDTETIRTIAFEQNARLPK